MTRIRFRCLPARPRPSRRVRLLAAAAVPLTLASVTLPTSGHTPPAAGPARTRAVAGATTTAAGGRGLRPVSLPGLRAHAVTVTLITGDQVRLSQVSPGRYTAAAVPGSGPAAQISFQGKGSPRGPASLQAVPAEAGPLLSAGKLSLGLFDVLWLAAHGDTGPAAHIPVTLRYPGRPTAAALKHDAATLPGVTVAGASAAQGEVRIDVAAGRAGAFWAALTGHDTAATAGPGRPAPTTLHGNPDALWLTGHDTSTAVPRPQDSQPLYPVTVTYTRTVAGPLIPQPCLYIANMGQFPASRMCMDSSSLLGVAGGGLDNSYFASSWSCAKIVHAKPYPLCTVEQASFEVPPGVYAESATAGLHTTEDTDHTEEDATAELDVPQFTVAGPTSLTVNANRIAPVTISTPQPARPYGFNSIGFIRSTPDGTRFYTTVEVIPSQGFGNFWALPTPAAERATIGSYTFNVELTMGAPLVTAQVTTPRQLALHPLYQCDAPGAFDCYSPGGGMVRFSGSHTLQLVDAGIGSPAAFRKIDARGKLAFIHAYYGSCNPNPWPGHACAVPGIVLNAQLAAARQAGAAGVLFGDGDTGYGTGCCWAASLPQYLVPDSPQARVIPLPFAQVDSAEENALTGLLAKGPVTVTMTDHGTSPYTYNLSLYQEGGISASQHYTLTARQLAEVTDSYHAAAATPAAPVDEIDRATFAPNQIFAVGSSWDVLGPRSVRDYYGPLSPSVDWAVTTYIPGGRDLANAGGANYVFGQPGHADVGWSTPPVAPGARMMDPAVLRAQPGVFTLPCAGCRQGSTFYPWFILASGANPAAGLSGAVGFAPGSIHLYDQAGDEIPPGTQNGRVIYTLPAGRQRYRLDTTYQSTGYGTTNTTTTVWDFTSAQPKAGEYAPYGYSCFGTRLDGSTDPCNVPALVFLRYNAHASPGNTLAAPGRHVLQVTGYHQDPSAPPMTSLELWLSTDGGTTWQRAHLTDVRDGTWNAPYTLPRLSQTGGYLSIKATAIDTAGNDVTQTILDAVKLAAPHGR